MNWEQLIAIGRLLAQAIEHGETRGRPQQARLRRGISAVYYALFHALSYSNADALVGSSPDIRQSAEWARTYRALDHRFAKDRFNATTAMGEIPNKMQDFGNTFVALQNQRHDADYNPHAVFQRSETVRTIDRAEAAIDDLVTTDLRARRAPATYVLFRPR